MHKWENALYSFVACVNISDNGRVAVTFAATFPAFKFLEEFAVFALVVHSCSCPLKLDAEIIFTYRWESI